MAALQENVAGFRRFGAAALDMAFVARAGSTARAGELVNILRAVE
jgi:fructose-1,6-bisphosphatase/inositol monophosphatase family enzyme